MTIPPPPPGYKPTAAQIVAMSGQAVSFYSVQYNRLA